MKPIIWPHQRTQCIPMTTTKEIRPGKVGEHLVPSFSLVPRLSFGSESLGTRLWETLRTQKQAKAKRAKKKKKNGHKAIHGSSHPYLMH